MTIKAKIDKASLRNFEEQLEATLMLSADLILAETTDKIIDQAPKNSGQMVDSIGIDFSKKVGKRIKGAINTTSIYLFAVWKGVKNTHFGEMSFSILDWPQWDPAFGARPNKSGWFFFAPSVKHVVPENPFVERALHDISYIRETIATLINKRFGDK